MRLPLSCLLPCAVCGFFAAAHADTLPDPLSLRQAIDLIDERHPDLLSDQLSLRRAQNAGDMANAENAPELKILSRLRWFESGRDTNTERQDHSLRIRLAKNLYDGGRGNALAESARQAQAAAALRIKDRRGRYTIEVMQKFFAVLLADLQAGRDNEAMAIAFIRFNRGQDHMAMGRISDVELLRLENDFQDSRLKVVQSEGLARSTRQSLALALNRPGQQPSALVPPRLDVNHRRLLDFDALLEKILRDNRQLAALELETRAAQAAADAAQAPYRPRADAIVEHGDYSRNLGSHDTWRAGIEMSWSPYDGGRQEHAATQARLRVDETIYRRREMELALRHQVRQLSEAFALLTAQRQAADVFAEYRELYMDRSRSLYEMEVRADLGDAMIQVSESLLRDARQQFDMALTLAQLNLLAAETDVMNWDALTEKVETQP